MEHSLDKKREHLLTLLREWRRVAVAFSGGVDSAVVAKAAVLAVGDAAVAVTARSPALAAGELEIAKDVATGIGIRHIVVETAELQVADYRANAGRRCYYCKDELYTKLKRTDLNVDVLCNGANTDDLGDYRPGMQAADEHGVRSPLIEAGLSKNEVRELAKLWDLPVWNKPSTPCLASRIAIGVTVTEERLRRIDAAEQFLREEFQIAELRVRCEERELARIEVPLNQLLRLTTAATRISQQFRALGFQAVTLDLEGFRSGSLNPQPDFVPLARTYFKTKEAQFQTP